MPHPQRGSPGTWCPSHTGLFTPARAAHILVSRASLAAVSNLEGQAQGPWALSPRWAELCVSVSPRPRQCKWVPPCPPWNMGPSLCHPVAVLVGGGSCRASGRPGSPQQCGPEKAARAHACQWC